MQFPGLVKNSSATIFSDDLLFNELYRFGGINSIRGFEENWNFGSNEKIEDFSVNIYFWDTQLPVAIFWTKFVIWAIIYHAKYP